MPSSSTLARPDSWGKLILIFLICSHLHSSPLRYLHVGAVLPGSWELLVENGGVSAMHMALTHLNTVIIYDRTDYGPSEMKLPDGRCRHDPRDMALKVDCYAHSVELDLSTNSVRPLEVLTDTWCSSASFLADGSLVSTGGWNDGSNAVRMLVPCDDGRCDWEEGRDRLGASRWYASSHTLPDNDTVIVVGGRRSFSYEFVPTRAVFSLPFLYETNEPSSENNLYPFLHLSSDGNLFVFANSKSILLDYKAGRVVRKFPELPGGGSRNYPSSGSSVMLPLSASDGFRRVEVMVCGGAPHGAWQQVTKRAAYPQALATCGRMVITDPDPGWSMEEMPWGRVMGDMLILPTSEILIINGAKQGTAGWGCATDPSLSPFLYNPSGSGSGSRFHVLAASAIPRMYHSSAVLLPDARVLVAGSNTNEGYTFSDVPFPTELRIEAFRPYYLHPSFDTQRPRIVAVSPVEIAYGALFEVDFTVGDDEGTSGSNDTTVEFKVYAPSFSTHSTQMNQRLLLLEPVSVSVSVSVLARIGEKNSHASSSSNAIVWRAVVKAPPSAIAAPSGYYLLYVVVNAAVPSTGSWVRISPAPVA